ncbi:hypothetical protein [uncultured Campylobacter sp.]|uniref:hypothetical protein n=1 Tax=uncultured Campylobacter sp. TaxID=218934 RepID=UPI00262E9AF0|nr:hypothetical protein [uncultured Campylobacter sp.]
MIEELIQKSKNITAAGRSDIEPTWIAQAQRRLGFALPASYKQMLLRYASVSAAGTELKTIAPPEFADSADEGICYTYEINLKNGLFAADEFVFLQLEDEEYYFKISPASDIADGSSNTARGKTAESTSGEAAGATARDTVVAMVSDGAENRASDDEACAERSLDAARNMNNMNAEAPDETKCKTAGATTSEAAGDAASGATKEITSEQAGDAPCEYPVYVRDYAEGEDRLFADDFYGFLEKF